MEYADGKVKDLQIAYIGGGSRGWAWTFDSTFPTGNAKNAAFPVLFAKYKHFVKKPLTSLEIHL